MGYLGVVQGYTTPEKCLDIDLKEFRARKGVGAKTTLLAHRDQDERRISRY